MGRKLYRYEYDFIARDAVDTGTGYFKIQLSSRTSTIRVRYEYDTKIIIRTIPYRTVAFSVPYVPW
eukprot:scaffold287500_cov19-Prasinocladus_malaysianus.AAC.1